jgi:hypothetical protein|tara:strand:+ start:1657 stop:2235 length:579 start_codon:yes stop_codon:yes gene_type:complete
MSEVLQIIQKFTRKDSISTSSAQSAAFTPTSTGIIRVTNDSVQGGYVEISGNPTATTSSVFLGSGLSNTTVTSGGTSTALLYVKPKRSTVSACTKVNGQPVITLSTDREGNPFRVGDYMTMTGASVNGYNTAIAHILIAAQNTTTVTCTATVDTSGLSDFAGTAVLRSSYKVAGITAAGTMTLNLQEVAVTG